MVLRRLGRDFALRRALRVVRLLCRPALDAQDAYAAAAAVYEDVHWLWLLVGGAVSERALLRDARRIARNGAGVLDAGCGTGRLARVVRRTEPTARLVLLDASQAMLDHVDRALGPRVRGDARALPFGDQTFDLVIAAWSLETTPDPQHSLDECMRVLRPGGVLTAAFCAAPSSRLIRLITWLPRRIVERSFAGRFLDPMLRPTVLHEELYRGHGHLQLAVRRVSGNRLQHQCHLSTTSRRAIRESTLGPRVCTAPLLLS